MCNLTNEIMGATKRTYEEMELNELMSHYFTHEEDDEYWYQRHKEEQEYYSQLEAEQQALTECFSHGL